MSVPGLSLVGFMDQSSGVSHLEKECVPSNANPAALIAEWTAAKQNLGLPTPRAGSPDIQNLPTATDAYTQQLSLRPWLTPYLHDPAFGFVSFSYVEIDPLLAFQFTVNGDRSSHHGSFLSRPPRMDEMLAICLPTIPPPENFTVQQQDSSLIIQSRSLNVRKQDFGMWNANFAGVVFGTGFPLTLVSNMNGKYYLSNGFHRAYCLRDAGATHMPCVLRTVTNPEAVGIREPGTFGLPLLVSANPPTLGHFTQGRAHKVELRSTMRVIHISWSEWVISDEM